MTSIDKDIKDNIELLKILTRYLHDDSYQEPKNINQAISYLLGAIMMFKKKDDHGTINKILLARQLMKKVMETCDDRGNCYIRMKNSYNNLRKTCDDISPELTLSLIK